jgi:hypothetical protein
MTVVDVVRRTILDGDDKGRVVSIPSIHRGLIMPDNEYTAVFFPYSRHAQHSSFPEIVLTPYNFDDWKYLWRIRCSIRAGKDVINRITDTLKNHYISILSQVSRGILGNQYHLFELVISTRLADTIVLYQVIDESENRLTGEKLIATICRMIATNNLENIQINSEIDKTDFSLTDIGIKYEKLNTYSELYNRYEQQSHQSQWIKLDRKDTQTIYSKKRGASQWHPNPQTVEFSSDWDKELKVHFGDSRVGNLKQSINITSPRYPVLIDIPQHWYAILVDYNEFEEGDCIEYIIHSNNDDHLISIMFPKHKQNLHTVRITHYDFMGAIALFTKNLSNKFNLYSTLTRRQKNGLYHFEFLCEVIDDTNQNIADLIRETLKECLPYIREIKLVPEYGYLGNGDDWGERVWHKKKSETLEMQSGTVIIDSGKQVSSLKQSTKKLNLDLETLQRNTLDTIRGVDLNKRIKAAEILQDGWLKRREEGQFQKEHDEKLKLLESKVQELEAENIKLEKKNVTEISIERIRASFLGCLYITVFIGYVYLRQTWLTPSQPWDMVAFGLFWVSFVVAYLYRQLKNNITRIVIFILLLIYAGTLLFPDNVIVVIITIIGITVYMLDRVASVLQILGYVNNKPS